MLEERQLGRQRYAHCTSLTWLPLDGESEYRIDADLHRMLGTCESKSAEGEARQGFGEREGKDKDRDLGEYQSG